MISVCLTSFNGEKYIVDQLNSILSQLGPDDEIIISDDGSSDRTVEKIAAIADQRIVVLYNTRHTTYTRFKASLTTRNMGNALARAKGDYVFLADQDDVWLETRIQEVLPFLDQYQLVVNNCFVVDQNLAVINESYFDLISSGRGFFKNLARNGYLGCCIAFRKDLLSYILPFPKIAVPHDIWIGLIAEIFGSVLFLNKQLLYYRRHNSNVSTAGKKSTAPIYLKIGYRVNLLNAIISRLIIRKVKK